MIVAFLVIVVIVAAAGFYFGQQYLSSRYFIGPSQDGGNVAIYQGIDTNVAGYSLAEEVDDTGIPLDMLPENERNAVESTISLDDRQAGDDKVAELRSQADTCESDPESCGMSASTGIQDDATGTEHTPAPEDNASASADSASENNAEDPLEASE